MNICQLETDIYNLVNKYLLENKSHKITSIDLT